MRPRKLRRIGAYIATVTQTDRYWVNEAGDNSWNNANNWSYESGGSGGAGVPQAGHDVVFDGNGTGNCTLDVAATADLNSLDFQSGYTGTFNANGNTVNVSGNVTFVMSGAGVINLGTSSTWNIADGTWDTSGWGGTTFTESTSTVSFSGTSQISGNIDCDFYGLTIASGTTTLNAATVTRQEVRGALTVAGTLTLNDVLKPIGITCNLTGGSINGAGTLQIVNGSTVTLGGGTIGSSVVVQVLQGITLNAGTYGGASWSFQSDATPRAIDIDGNAVFESDVTITANVAGNYTVDATGVTLEFKGSLTLVESGGTVVWTSGTGITLSGTGDQDITTLGKSMEKFLITNTAGRVSFLDGFHTAELEVTSAQEAGGIVDFDELDAGLSHQCDGNMTFDGLGTVDCGSGGATITCGGNFDATDQNTWTGGTSELILTGSSKTVQAVGQTLYKVTVNGTYSLDAGYVTTVANTFTVGSSGVATVAAFAQWELKGDVDINGELAGGANSYLFLISSNTLTIGATGEISGSFNTGAEWRNLTIDNTAGGDISATITLLRATTISGGSYSGNITFQSGASGNTLTVGTAGGQTLTFTGNISFVAEAGETFTVKCDSFGGGNDPDLVFEVNVTLDDNTTGTLNWTKGDGTITLSGTNNQTITTPAGWTDVLEAITHDKAGGGDVTLAGGGLYCVSFNLSAQNAANTFDTNDVVLNTTGDQTYGGSGTVDCGASTITCGGNFSCSGQTTWTRGSSTIKLDGTSVTYSSIAKLQNKVQISGTVSITAAGTHYAGITAFTLDNTKTLALSAGVILRVDRDITIDGTISGDGTFRVFGGSFGNVISYGGSVTCGTFQFQRGGSTPAGTYSPTTFLINSESGFVTFTPGGTITVTGALSIDVTGSTQLDIANDTNDASWVLQGNVTIAETAGTVVWSKAATGTITLSGTNDQTITLPSGWTGAAGEILEDIVVDNTAGQGVGGIILASDLFTDGISFGASADCDFDAVTYDITLGTGGLNCTNGGSATLDMGSGTWTCSGNWDHTDIGVFTKGTSTLVMDTDGTTIETSSKTLYDLSITGSTVSVTGANCSVYHDITISGILDVPAGKELTQSQGNQTFTLTGTGTLSGDGTYTVYQSTINSTAGGTWSIATSNIRMTCICNLTGTLGGNWNFLSYSGTRTLTFSAGPAIFEGDVSYDCDDVGETYTILNNTNNPSHVYKGNVTFAETGGTVVYTKGSGTIQFDGSSTITLTKPADWDNELEKFQMADAATCTVQLAAGSTATTPWKTVGLDFEATAGVCTFDANGEDITLGTSGLDCTNGGSATLDMGEGTWATSGDFDASGLLALDDGTSTLVCNTGCTAIASLVAIAGGFRNVTIAAGVSVTSNTSNGGYINGNLDIGAGSTLDTSGGSLYLRCQGTVTLNATGTITGSVLFETLGASVTTNGGTWSLSSTTIKRDVTLNAGTYGGTFILEPDNASRTLTIGGAVTWTGNVTFQTDTTGTYTVDTGNNTLTIEGSATFTCTEAGTLAINTDVDAPNWVFQGNVTIENGSGTTNWTKGGGTITLSGGDSQALDKPADWDNELEALVIDKTAGTVSLVTGSTATTPWKFVGLSYSANASNTSVFDANDEDITLGTSGLDCTNGADYTILMGDGSTWTCSGNLDIADIGTLTRETSTLVMDTDGTSIIPSADNVQSLNITGNVSVDGSNPYSDLLGVLGTLTVASGKTLTCNSRLVVYSATITVDGTIDVAYDYVGALNMQSSGTLTINAGGKVTGIGGVQLSVAGLTIANSGTWDVATVLYSATTTFGAGTYSSIFTFYAPNTLTLTTPAGGLSIIGLVCIPNSGKTHTINNSANGNLTFSGNITLDESSGGTVTWTKGTGTITLSGTDDQIITTPALWTDVLEAINISKDASTAKVTLAGDVYTAALTGSTGRLDVDGNTIYSSSNVILDTSMGFQLHNGTNNDMDNGSIEIDGGFLDLNGTSGENLQVYNLDFDIDSAVTAADAVYTVVTNSQVTGTYGDIDATDPTNTDSGSPPNSGWDFGGGVSILTIYQIGPNVSAGIEYRVSP